MPSNVTNRQTIREALASAIDAVLDGTWDVFNYGTSVFNGKARNVVIASGDTDYQDNAADADELSNTDVEFDFGIAIFILYADDTQSWTARNSEDALDLGRKKIADFIRDNRKTVNWSNLRANGRSRVGLAEDEGGVPYRFEIVPVRIEIYA